MIVRREPVYVRRRRVAAGILVSTLALTTLGVGKLLSGPAAAAPGTSAKKAAAAKPASVTTPVTRSTPVPTTTPATTTPAVTHSTAARPAGTPGPSARTTMVRIDRITGHLSPKSVVASKQGQVFAQNMMYTHTISAFSADGTLKHTINDAVDLAKYGVTGHPGLSKGSPVEMAFSPDGRTAWVSNYAMYGANFSAEGRDACTGPQGVSPSYVYEIDTASYAIKRVVRVGTVPKYVAMTPNGKQVLVTNWCSMDMSVIDAKTAKVVATIPMRGAHPRGIAVSPNSATAYVAVMGTTKVVAVDLKAHTSRDFAVTGKGPRHIVISPDGRSLYVTNNTAGKVSEVDAHTGAVRRSVTVGKEPRSMAISSDGGALYVVNYGSAEVDKIRTSDLKIIQQVRTDGQPIGITFEPTHKAVWVACYGGSILVFDDSRVATT